MDSNEVDHLPNIRLKKTTTPQYVVELSKLRRFDRRNTIFERLSWDSSWEGYKRMYDENVVEIVHQGKLGYSRLDFSLAYAAWIVHDAFEGGFSFKRILKYRDSAGSVGVNWKTKYDVKNPEAMSADIKRVAGLFGASLVGIAELNKSWLYADVNIPTEIKNVIVVAIEMDAEGIATSPSALSAAVTGIGYSKMSFIAAGVGEFIRNLGYRALQCGNDTALSIPLAIDAGLGELGRNGLLITPQYGPRVRLCKIFTDIPLKADKPIEFGVRKFCRTCKKCAKNCEADAISDDDEPSFDIVCLSNNPGVKKWYVNSELCYLYWCENGIDCSTCISVCPYNVSSGVNVPLSPDEFWEKKIPYSYSSRNRMKQ